jgi:hypothetical protein
MNRPRHPFSHLVPIVALGILGLAGCSSAPPKAGAPVADSGPEKKPPVKVVEKPKPPVQEVPKFEHPGTVKGIYLTAWSAGRTVKMNQVASLIQKSEINSVVIDVRDSGNMYFKTGIPLAQQSGAHQVAVVKPKELMKFLSEKKIYPIARIACFRDNFVPKKFPDLGVRLPDGRLWKDRSGNTWLDPYNRKNWDYLAATVDFALDLGFPEIQLDYVRFPSEGKSSTQRYAGKKTYPDANAKHEDVIAAFAKFIADRVHKRGAVLSADIFGIISSSASDQGIGQALEKVAAPFDVISPMVYPSHFARGEYGIPNPDAAPYAIVKKSLADYKKRLPKAKVRPWLQDFSLGVKYGKAEVLAQIKAARECGYDEYLLWNPANHYTSSALVLAPNAAKPVGLPQAH